MSESDEKLQKGIIELDKGNDKKAFGFFKEVFESRQEKLLLKVQDNPKSPTLMLDALYMIHALVWLRVAEAGKDKARSTELLGKAVGTVEAARTANHRRRLVRLPQVRSQLQATNLWRRWRDLQRRRLLLQRLQEAATNT